MLNTPDPNVIFPNEYGTSCFVKNVVHAPNIEIGDYTYYDDDTDPTGFERNNVLFNYPEFGDRLIIGKFCALAQGTTFIMGSANHRTGSASTYPFNVFGGAWTEATPDHMSQLPRKGDTVVGNDVWLGRECVVMPGVKIGDGSPLHRRRRQPRAVYQEPLRRGADRAAAAPQVVGSPARGACRMAPHPLRRKPGKSPLRAEKQAGLTSLRRVRTSNVGKCAKFRAFPHVFVKPIPCFPRLDIQGGDMYEEDSGSLSRADHALYHSLRSAADACHGHCHSHAGDGDARGRGICKPFSHVCFP